MKNRLTLLIASILLILCVIQKEARYGSAKDEGVEKMSNFSPIGPSDGEVIGMEFASADTATARISGSARLANQNLLNISAGSKLLNY
jgi:hypothetical protein